MEGSFRESSLLYIYMEMKDNFRIFSTESCAKLRFLSYCGFGHFFSWTFPPFTVAIIFLKCILLFFCVCEVFFESQAIGLIASLNQFSKNLGTHICPWDIWLNVSLHILLSLLGNIFLGENTSDPEAH